MIIYVDWMAEKHPIGEAEIMEFQGYTPKFEHEGNIYRGEKVLVRYTDGIEEEAIIRVDALPDLEFTPKRDMEETFYQDRFQVYIGAGGKSYSDYDTTFWNERIGDFSSFGNIY
jgi:hypothetical protein